MSQENVEMVRHEFEVINRTGDVDWALINPEVEWRNFEDAPQQHPRGYERLREWLREMKDGFSEEIAIELSETIDLGFEVVAVCEIWGRGKVSGMDIAMPIANVWTVHDGKVVKVVSFHSKREALEAAGFSAPGDSHLEFSGDLGDGMSGDFSIPVPDSRVNATAVVALRPSNTFTFGKVKDNKNNGTATLAVNVPGPGTLSLTGKGVKTQRPGGAIASKAVAAAGTVKLLVKPKGSAKHKLNKTGKAKVKVKVTYTPTGGNPATQSERVKLVKK